MPSQTLLLGGRTLIMGVLNVTPDSFSDGGNLLPPETAVQRALQMEREGADIIDVGAESTRPGSAGVGAEEEWRRLAPVLTALRSRLKIPISIDTRKSEIAAKAVESGAEIINDVSGLRHDARVAEVAARARVALVLMHVRGEPETMQQKPFARDVVKDVIRGLRVSVGIARKAGVLDSRIILDPGIGFGKSYAQNYEVLGKLRELARMGFPLLVGTSRKGFISKTLELDGKSASAEAKIWGTAGTVAAGILNGAHIVRVHDVGEMVSVARVVDCVLGGELA
ncbi:MAG: dihydropteroate synthase [Candidatus Acidiferrum sp.]